MLGSVSEAEDVVQQALLRLHQALQADEQIASPRALIATVTTRLAINGSPPGRSVSGCQRTCSTRIYACR
jgi:hypothetical protein